MKPKTKASKASKPAKHANHDDEDDEDDIVDVKVQRKMDRLARELKQSPAEMKANILPGKRVPKPNRKYQS